MYGFGGLGEVEVEIWQDVTIAGRTTNKKERQSYSAIGPWKAEMSNLDKRQVVSIETGGKSIHYKNLYSTTTILTSRQSTPRTTSTSKFNQYLTFNQYWLFRTSGSSEAGSEPSCKITTFFTKCILRLLCITIYHETFQLVIMFDIQEYFQQLN